MSLTIKFASAGANVAIDWHFSEPVPDIPARVVTFVADGDELEWLLAVMKQTRAPEPITIDAVAPTWEAGKKCGGCGKTLGGFHDLEPETCNSCGTRN